MKFPQSKSNAVERKKSFTKFDAGPNEIVVELNSCSIFSGSSKVLLKALTKASTE